MSRNYQLRKKAVILLEDGTLFYGRAVGNGTGTVFGELCFNTAMTGYQEIITDPNYLGQIVTFTNVHLGSDGVFLEDMESGKPGVAGIICKNFSYVYSRQKADNSLEKFLEEHNILAISDVDTRALVTYIRNKGTMNTALTTEIDQLERIQKELNEWSAEENRIKTLSTEEAYELTPENTLYRVAVIDNGVKKSILDNLIKRNCLIRVFPNHTDFDEIQNWKPDGILLSNGPGDPTEMTGIIETVKKINQHELPLFGIGLGHELIALANNIPVSRMAFGHYGLNHPVLNLKSGKGKITANSHSFMVESFENHPKAEITHIHLNDKSVAGIELKGENCFAVQFQPEAGPGPQDALYLFDDFIKIIAENKKD